PGRWLSLPIALLGDSASAGSRLFATRGQSLPRAGAGPRTELRGTRPRIARARGNGTLHTSCLLHSSDEGNRLMRFRAIAILTHVLVIATSAAQGQFTTVINLPGDPVPASISFGTQINVYEGGILNSFNQTFTAS